MNHLLTLLTLVCLSTNAKPALEEKFTKASDIVWASPNGFNLTMDIYTPNTGKASYPVIVMFHGGGWLINNKSIMDEPAAYLASHSDYVVCNVNYRLLVDQNNTVKMNDIVNDVFGAVLWVKDNISKYKGKPGQLIVTGDSAGGHLATMVALQGNNLESDGFQGNTLGFTPTYLPKGKTAEQVAKANGLAVQAALISYGAFDLYGSALGGFEKESNIFWSMGKAKARGIFGNGINPTDNPAPYKQVSPLYTIPKASERKLPPMLFTVGSKDNLTTPASIEAFMAKLKEAGHTNFEYWVHEGRPHAFLDSGSNQFLGTSFQKDAPPALDRMIAFLNKIFY
ncbi:alpha/beta hydrolase [Fibrella forsythiae]|uniref:Alpha/beta hydrolase n=1 Tax=Fibrella forsythiae TaxID=2817061 RepID=A0ABS3JG29_9BACT|nr:alpha/beta hydrolase [Fibrella forsythiae]MBO0948968.1 alpha/beta hydrolase [Fibrella forsythiae]